MEIIEEHLTFGDAINALETGLRVTRIGWNGKGMYVVKQVPAEISLDIIPKMISLPQSVKDHLIATNTTIKYSSQMLLIQADGRADSWVASSSDTFATDWVILD